MQQRKVLIVEDEQIVATELREILSSLGYSVVGIASSGPDALARADESRPDLILMDIRIKGEMDGIETAVRIMARWDVPVVFVTAHADQETLRRAKATGPMGYLLKPFSERELQVAIEMAVYKHDLEKQLKEQKQKLSAMLESIGDAVIAADQEGRVTLINPAASSLTGFTEAEALGREITAVLNIMDDTTPPDVEDSLARNIDTTKEMKTIHYASIIISKSGKVIPIDGTTNHIKNENGVRSGTIFAFRDVTGPTGHLDAARIMHFSINQATDLIFQIASDGLILEINEAVCNILGYIRDEILNRYTYEIEVYSSESQWERLWERGRRERALNYETSYWTKERASLPVDVRASHVRFAGREFLFAIARPIARAEGFSRGKQHTGAEA
jgi:PAS domain S-box-containing protein